MPLARSLVRERVVTLARSLVRERVVTLARSLLRERVVTLARSLLREQVVSLPSSLLGICGLAGRRGLRGNHRSLRRPELAEAVTKGPGEMRRESIEARRPRPRFFVACRAWRLALLTPQGAAVLRTSRIRERRGRMRRRCRSRIRRDVAFCSAGLSSNHTDVFHVKHRARTRCAPTCRTVGFHVKHCLGIPLERRRSAV